MPLHTDLRPATFDEVVGNEETVKGLQALLTKKSPNRAILLHGPSGCGKTTLARILAREIGAFSGSMTNDPDYNELNTSDFRGIEMVREIRKTSQYQPIGQARVWLLDECHKLSPDAQEAILKLLEHPPSRNWYILATTEPGKLKPTLRRRVGQFLVSPLTDPVLRKFVIKSAKGSGISLPKSVCNQIVTESMGSAGMALAILDKLDGLDEDEMAAAIQQAAARENKTIALCRLLMKQPKWKEVALLLKELDEEDPETIRRIILEYFRKVFLGGNEGAFLILIEFQEPFYNSGKAGLAVACYNAISM